MQKLTVNGKSVEVDVDPAMPLLWVVRDVIGFKGTKFGCGKGLCGACTVHVGGQAVRSCSFPVGEVKDEVRTIEDLGPHHPVTRAWLEVDVPQCGYCQPGQMMACAALIAQKPTPSAEAVQAGMTNLCRCGTYGRIHQAAKRAVELAHKGGTK